MNSYWVYIERESSGLLNSVCPGCQNKSGDFNDHYICTSMPIYSYASENSVKSTYDGANTDYTNATKTNND